MVRVLFVGAMSKMANDAIAIESAFQSSGLSEQESDWAADAILALRVPGVPGREVKDLAAKFRELVESDSVDMTPRGSLEAWREYLLSLIVQ